MRDRSRTAGKKAHEIASTLTQRAAAGRDQAAPSSATGELADLAEATAMDAPRLLTNAQRALHRARATAAGQRTRGERAPVPCVTATAP